MDCDDGSCHYDYTSTPELIVRWCGPKADDDCVGSDVIIVRKYTKYFNILTKKSIPRILPFAFVTRITAIRTKNANVPEFLD